MKKKFLPFWFVTFVISSAFFAVSAVYAGETFIIGNVNYARSNSSEGEIGFLLFFLSLIWMAFKIAIKSSLEESRREKAKDELVQHLKGLPLILQIKLIGELPEEVRQEILERVQKEEAKDLAKKRSEEKSKERSSEQHPLDARKEPSKEESQEPHSGLSLVKKPILTSSEQTESSSRISLEKD